MMSDTDKPWFNQPCFDRYWKHYEQTFHWYRHHARNSETERLQDDVKVNRSPNYSNYGVLKDDKSTENDLTYSSYPEDEEDSSEEVIEMEITEELISFFEQSEHHRKELQVRRAESNKQKREDVAKANMEPVASWSHSETTALPSCVLPGAKRTTEMKYLYGNSAAIVHGMETSMQMKFDRFCDIHQPKLWPVIPLNL